MLIDKYVEQMNKYRKEIMGFAILMIVYFHSSVYLGEAVEVVKNTLYGGVDIFFLLTGVGVCYSLRKNSDIPSFYKRRLMRIMPSYIPIIILYCIPFFAAAGSFYDYAIAVRDLLGNIFGVGWISQASNQFNWYAQALLMFYLISPIACIIVRRINGSYKKTALLFVFLILLQLCFTSMEFKMASVRVIVFMMGLFFADAVLEKRQIKLNVPLMLIMFVIGTVGVLAIFISDKDDLWKYGPYWTPFIFIVPGAVLILSNVFKWMSKAKPFLFISCIFRTMGEASFEIYLVHILVFEWIKHPGTVYSNKMWVLFSLASIVLGVLYQRLIKCSIKLIGSRKKKGFFEKH